MKELPHCRSGHVCEIKTAHDGHYDLMRLIIVSFFLIDSFLWDKPESLHDPDWNLKIMIEFLFIVTVIYVTNITFIFSYISKISFDIF